jgi:SAM-dependent methyltransferase
MVDRFFADADLAALYDFLHPPQNRADFAFYLPLVMSAQSVLDVGCGTGAMLREARRRGHAGRLCGLDPALGMLAQARNRSDIEWTLGDLGSSAWKSAFDLIVMTGHAFQTLVSDDELRATLAAVRTALIEDGHFAFETRNPFAREWENWRPQNAIEAVDARGIKVRMASHVTTPFDGRVLSFTLTFTSEGWDQPQVSQSTLRFLDAGALSSFLAEAGLTIEEQFGGWDRQPLSDESREIITIARPESGRR